MIKRDWEFAKKYNLPIKLTIQNQEKNLALDDMDAAYVEDGYLVDSEEFTGQSSAEARVSIINKMEKMELGKKIIDFVIGLFRQRYWGCPIPIINCPTCGSVVPEKDLPVRLPEDVEFVSGAVSPLQTSESFLQCKCPKMWRAALRETDTMDTFVDSSWYFFTLL